MMPYIALKQVIRFANPATVMSGVLDLFLAQPFGTRSLAQRGFGLALNDGIKSFQKSIDSLNVKINDPILSAKIRTFCESSEATKNEIRAESSDEEVDLVVAILRSDKIQPDLRPDQISTVFNAYVAWSQVVESVEDEMRAGAELFAQLKQLLKLCTRQRDKAQMLSVIQEPVTLNLFRDLFTIFYEPLVRVYKSANVYNSVTDFAAFAEDAFSVLDAAQRQDASADPNQTVQAFIDLCARHQENFYTFVHEVHIHDDGLFAALMAWLEDILEFLRHGPAGGKLDMNALFQGAVQMRTIDQKAATAEIDALIQWQEQRKKWHQDKTRQKMAAEGTSSRSSGMGLSSSDFGLHQDDLAEINHQSSDSDEDEIDDGAEADHIASEKKRRARMADRLRRRAGEPEKPLVTELDGLKDGFLAMLRMVLAN